MPFLPVKPWQMTLVFLSISIGHVRVRPSFTASTIFCAASSRSSAGMTLRPDVGDDRLAELDVGAFEAHDQRHFEADFLDRGDHAFGDHVAFHDAAEDIDQNAFDLRVGGDDLEGGRDLFLVAPPPTSRKLAGSAP